MSKRYDRQMIVERGLVIELIEALEAVDHLINIHKNGRHVNDLEEALEITLSQLVDEKLWPMIVRARKELMIDRDDPGCLLPKHGSGGLELPPD